MAFTHVTKPAMLCAGGVLALIALSACGGDGNSRQERSAATRNSQPSQSGGGAAVDAPTPVYAPVAENHHDLEVFVEQRPVKPYMVVTSFRFPTPSNAGEEIGYIRERARREGGDAVLVKVVSGSLVRTDIEDRSLIEATVIRWR